MGIEKQDLSGKVALVTGANSGIGYETAKALAQMGASVVLAGRNPAALADAVSSIITSTDNQAVSLQIVDLADLAGTKAAAAEVAKRLDRLDILVNNAGVALKNRTVTDDGYESILAINHLGPFVFTMGLVDLLQRSAPARVVNVASDAHKMARGGFPFDDVQAEAKFSPMGRYGVSKLANILFTRELARRLDAAAVTVNAVHPGAVSTNLARDGDAGLLGTILTTLARPFFRSAAQGAQTSIWAAVAPDLDGVTGQYYANQKPASLTSAAQDDAAAARLWELTEELVAAANLSDG